ncbi:hypothetical protein [Maridesulfovibrio sp.]|uniref:hypothetical protein n=1 Tax=Maridesulfovibrio sp. TaxID=2795000 RepID=UPI002AA941A1|nr:hypothetical protein [Maridesulfovibrio sp.]
MRGDHAFLARLDNGGVTGVFGQDVKMRETAARAVEKETEKLLEQLIDWCAFGILAHGAEETIDVWVHINNATAASKEVESGSTCQTVVRDLDIVDEFCFGSL